MNDLIRNKAKIESFLKASLNIFDNKFKPSETLIQTRDLLLERLNKPGDISTIEGDIQQFHSELHTELLGNLGITNSNPR